MKSLRYHSLSICHKQTCNVLNLRFETCKELYSTNLPTFKLKSDIGGVLMSFGKADLKSSKVQVENNVI